MRLGTVQRLLELATEQIKKLEAGPKRQLKEGIRQSFNERYRELLAKMAWASRN